MTGMTEQLLIVGGSVRAAAASARRAGFEPLAIDRFADADLRGICRKFQQYDELRRLPELLLQMPSADWMYTGPLENHPRLIERCAKDRTLLGNGAASLRPLRNPRHVARALETAGLDAPQSSVADTALEGGDWLRKPRRAAGGFGIERLDAVRSSHREQAGGVYYQKFVSGRSLGANFIAVRGRAVLLGATQQLLGPIWGGSREFQYAGSVGPADLSPQQMQALIRIGDCIARRFPVQGLFGVDVIVNDQGVWVVEVNPRYTASVEILERAFRVAAIRWHVAACRDGDLPDRAACGNVDEAVERHGKLICYASENFVVNKQLERALCAKSGEEGEPRIADIALAGTRIRQHEPVVTVFAKGKSIADAQAGLRDMLGEVNRMCRASAVPKQRKRS